MQLAVIIATHNQPDHFTNLYRSLTRQTYRDFNTYVVDNGSGPEVKAFIAAHFPPDNTCFLEENRGYAAASNIGIKMATAKGTSHFLVVNPDVELEPEAIESLSGAAQEDRGRAGIIAPVVLYGGDKKGERVILTCGVEADFRKCTFVFSHNGDAYASLAAGGTVASNMYNGAVFLLSKAAVEQIGYLDESFFMYGEEVDYAYRLHQAGFTVHTVTRAVAWHHHDRSKENKTIHFRQYYYQTRNRILYLKKYHRRVNLFISVVRELITIPFKWRWARKFADGRLVKYYYQGILNGLLGETGKTGIQFGETADG